eukprot:421863-Karenia_brevis.AAC.1
MFANTVRESAEVGYASQESADAIPTTGRASSELFDATAEVAHARGHESMMKGCRVETPPELD